MNSPTTLIIATAVIGGIIVCSIIHSVFIRPFVLVGVLRNYIQSGIEDMPTEESFALLDSKSSKFKKLHDSIFEQAVMPVKDTDGKDRDINMSVAESFVEKLYSDDNFLISVIKASGINDVSKGHKTTETETNDMMAKAARELGYEISTEEYAAALKAQTQKVGAWKAIKFLIRLTRLAKKAEKGKV